MMSDCIKCWSTPCRCGWDYIGWSESDLKEQIVMLKNILSLTLQFQPDEEKIKKEFKKQLKEEK